MAKNNPVKVHPKSLNESTLETNIVSEIAGLFNSPFNFGYSHRFRLLFGLPLINLNAFRKRKTKLYRLTPQEENKGGGWDTKITIPCGKNESRAIFIQFKRGLHSDGNNVKGSIFNVSKKKPNPNAEFTFNDNTSKNPASSNNQHNTLKLLSDHLSTKGIDSKTVMYGFPRITKLEDFEKLEDDLLLHTTFITIQEIDEKAKNAGCNLYDGKIHHFRTCYFDEKRMEISSVPFELDGSGEFVDVLYEIILVKLAHLKNLELQTNSNLGLFLLLADYLKINPFIDDVIFDNELENLPPEFRLYFKILEENWRNNLHEIFTESNAVQNQYAWRVRLFRKVVNFFNDKGKGKIDITLDIPSKHTFNLSKEKIEIDMENDYEISLLVF